MTLDEMLELQVGALAKKADPKLRVEFDAHEGSLIVPYPYVDRSNGQIRLAAVRTYSVTGGSGFHTVVLSASNENGKVSFGIWCGDAYLEGRAGTVARALDASSEIKRDLPDADLLISRLKMVNGAVESNGKCNFWPAWMSGKGGCKHVAAVLADLAVCNELPNVLKGLERELARMLGEVASIGAVKIISMCPALRWLNSLYETPVTA